MSLFLAALGLMGTGFGRMGSLRKPYHVAAPPSGTVPTYYILGF